MDERTHWRLCDLASAEIEALAGEGIACTPEDVLRIQWLAQQVESPASRMALSRGSPVHVGGAVLWPLTIAADEWWRSVIPHIDTQTGEVAALAYAMAHCRMQDALDAIPPTRAADISWSWVQRLQCTAGELDEAVRQVRDQDDCGPDVRDPKHAGGDSSRSNLVAFLVATAGGTPELWERQVAIGYVRQQIEAIRAQEAAEFGGDREVARRISATRTLGLAVEEIRQSRKVAKNGK